MGNSSLQIILASLLSTLGGLPVPGDQEPVAVGFLPPFAEGLDFGRLATIGVIVLIVVLVTWVVKRFVSHDD